jgi:hypothetical protein
MAEPRTNTNNWNCNESMNKLKIAVIKAPKENERKKNNPGLPISNMKNKMEVINHKKNSFVIFNHLNL